MFTETVHLGEGDCLVIWNRYGRYHQSAKEAEKQGARVLVAENGYLGRDADNGPWYAIAESAHNGAGLWPARRQVPKESRRHLLRATCLPWHTCGGDIVLLPQRGIGLAGVAMPLGWTERTLFLLKRQYPKTKFRVRTHPGKNEVKPLLEDLKSASAVVTWGSGAAIKSLTYGVPVFYEFDQWIGAPASASWTDFPERYCCDDAREFMLERLAWAQWRLSEIEDGTAFKELLYGHHIS